MGNMNLITINASDYVSPDTINDNFEKLDVLGLDYVVESGTSGEWWYRKWKSGRAECGIDDKNFGNMSHNIAWSFLWRTPEQSFGAYPFSFSARPFVTISFNSNSAGSLEHYSYIATGTSTSTTTSPKFYLVDVNNNPITDARFGIYVCGKYK